MPKKKLVGVKLGVKRNDRAKLCQQRTAYKNPKPVVITRVSGLFLPGGAKEIRTPGLYNANVARYQLCYSPKRLRIVAFLARDFKGKFAYLERMHKPAVKSFSNDRTHCVVCTGLCRATQFVLVNQFG